MAFSASRIERTVAGNLIMEVWSFNAASVTGGVVGVGISHISAVHIDNETSGMVAGQKALVSDQNVTLSGLNSNDTGKFTVIGH